MNTPMAVTRGAFPVDLDLELGHFADTVDESARHAPDLRDRVQDLLRLGAQEGRIFAKHFDDNLAVDLGNAFQDVVTNRL